MKSSTKITDRAWLTRGTAALVGNLKSGKEGAFEALAWHAIKLPDTRWLTDEGLATALEEQWDLFRLLNEQAGGNDVTISEACADNLYDLAGYLVNMHDGEGSDWTLDHLVGVAYERSQYNWGC